MANKRTKFVKRDEFDELRTIVKELAEGLNRLEIIVENLAKQVSVLTDARGYGLEAIADVTLPSYLSQKYKIKTDTFMRRFVEVDGKEIELNLFAEGKKGKKTIPVIIECKSTIYEKDVRSFYNNKIKPINDKLWKNTINVMVSYLIHPSGYKTAKELNIIIVASIPHYLA